MLDKKSPFHFRTATGKMVEPSKLSLEDIDIFDIATSLGNICRYNGHIDFFYSVAQHCWLVSCLIKRDYPQAYELQMVGLLHDAAEAYMQDLIRPIKYRPEMAWYRETIKKIEYQIYKKFRLTPSVRELDLVKSYDDYMYLIEQRDLMQESWCDLALIKNEELKIARWEKAAHYYLDRFNALKELLWLK